MSGLDYFKFEVRPTVYAVQTVGGKLAHTKVYRIHVTMNGTDYALDTVEGPPPYMTEIEWLIHEAVRLQEKLKAEQPYQPVNTSQRLNGESSYTSDSKQDTTP